MNKNKINLFAIIFLITSCSNSTNYFNVVKPNNKTPINEINETDKLAINSLRLVDDYYSNNTILSPVGLSLCFSGIGLSCENNENLLDLTGVKDLTSF